MTVPLYNLTDTWNNGATIFAAIKMNVTDSGSDDASKLIDLQVGSESKFHVTKNGTGLVFGGMKSYDYFVCLSKIDDAKSIFIPAVGYSTPPGVRVGSTSALAWSSTGDASDAADSGISRSSAGVLAFGNGTAGDASATIKAKTKAGAPTTSDVPDGTWALIRDTSGLTTNLVYNNGGTLQSVALT